MGGLHPGLPTWAAALLALPWLLRWPGSCLVAAALLGQRLPRGPRNGLGGWVAGSLGEDAKVNRARSCWGFDLFVERGRGPSRTIFTLKTGRIRALLGGS